ncbi:MAG TPA: hypothetical protein VGV61_12345, partial [Thermoanaerobaculia bacterium]|nr:hypothetical protein [Thermoanaerobaculia bacterium]
MPRPWPWHITSCLVSGCFAAVLVAASASAAIVNEQTIALDVRADGTVREQVTLRVTIERDADFDRWSPYPIFLDSHRRL